LATTAAAAIGSAPGATPQQRQRSAPQQQPAGYSCSCRRMATMMTKALEKAAHQQIKGLEKRAEKAWGTVMSELSLDDDGPDDAAAADEPPQPIPPVAGCAYSGGGELWRVLVDRTVRQYPGEDSKKLGKIKAGVRVQLLETATRDGRGKIRLKVRGPGVEGWVSTETGSGRDAMEECTDEAQKARSNQRANLRNVVATRQQAREEQVRLLVVESPWWQFASERQRF
jgi:uncharacterized protein YgiM (DUF1202 family)